MTSSPLSPLWTSPEIANAMGGDINTPPFEAYGVSIDTRTLQPGDLFVALSGERDGHDFVPLALEKGAVAALVDRAMDGPAVRVDDTLRALERLGLAARDRASQARRAAVTGSVGKTSVTQAIAAALKLAGPSHNSVQSYNNHIGVPLTLARTPRETAFAVFEIGMNHAGEIGPLSKMVRPHVAVITMVGPVHIENFPDGEAGVARAKAEIFEGMEPGGIVVLNADDAWFGLLSDAATGAGLEVRTFGTGEGCDARLIDFRASPIEGKGAIVHATLHGAPISFPIAQTGAHWGLNALATLLAVEALGAPMDAAIRALSDFAPLAGRGVQMRIAIPGGGVTLIDDSYNANPVSMRAALTTLGAYKTTGRRIAVLTDMLEMGADTDAIHAALAEPIAAAKVDAVYCAGPAMQALYDALPAARRGAWRQAAADLAPLVVEILAPDDVIMVKGSKGSKASLVVAALASLGEAR